MLPFFLPVMQLQRCLMNFLCNSVELHQTPAAVAATKGAKGQGVQTQAVAEGSSQLHPPSANKSKRRIKSVSRRAYQLRNHTAARKQAIRAARRQLESSDTSSALQELLTRPIYSEVLLMSP